MKNILTAQPARGTVGCLIRLTSGDVAFRVYDSTGDFKDYDIAHCDMLVKIVDDDATFYEFEDGSLSVDHDPETLGIASSLGQELQ
jgi:hypothetical protein